MVPTRETSRQRPVAVSSDHAVTEPRGTGHFSSDAFLPSTPAPPSRYAAMMTVFRAPRFLAPFLPWLTMSWLIGVVFLSLRHLAGWRQVRAWRQSGEPVAHSASLRLASDIRRALHIKLRVPLMQSADVLAPMVVGTIRPMVLLPLRLITGFRPCELQAILAHEFAHIARGDAWANLSQAICQTALFYHPAVAWMGRRARIERENAADDLATNVCADRVQYAAALARLAETVEARHPLVLAATDGILLARIRRLLAPAAQETNHGWASAALTLVALIYAIFFVSGLSEFREPSTAGLSPLSSSPAALPEETRPSPPLVPEGGTSDFPEVKLALGQSPESLLRPLAVRELSSHGGGALTGADLFGAGNLANLSGQIVVAQGVGVLKQTSAVAAKPAEEATRNPADDAKKWVEDAFQLDDAARRTAAIERIRTAMQSANMEEAREGIKAFVRLGPIEFDKASFRPTVRTLLGSSDAATRAAAASAFTMTGADPEDLERILALADDSAPEVRDPLTWIIVRLTKGDLTGKPASDAILKLMNNLPRDSRSVAHAIWGVKFSPEIEARVLEFCRDIPAAGNSIVGYNFFYGALSTQANKSEASCKRLIELLAHQDTTNIAGRSAWGLQQGVAREQFPLVADAMVKVIEARSDGYLRDNALRCLRTYGDARNAPALRTLLAKPGVTGEMRKVLEETAESLEKRTAEAPPTAPPSTAPAAQATPATATTVVAPAAPAAATPPEPLVRDDALVEQNRRTARLRATEDRRHYSPEQLQEIETLYQVANTKGKRTPEAKASLKQLLEKNDTATRTGCATHYLGHASEGAERLEYLTRAVEKFSDCYYFNGCQVGGYGRYVLALTLWEKGEKEKARKLLEELKTKYKDATDHNGRPMGKVAEAVEQELLKQK
jgi:beta-lactamase regulating signal transducer with metallopeptidase domain